MKKIILISFITLLTIAGCGYKEGVKTPEQTAYVYFTGNVDDASVALDGGSIFSVRAGQEHQYKIKPGKHTIQVFKNSKLIINREIYLGEGVAKEIEIQP